MGRINNPQIRKKYKINQPFFIPDMIPGSTNITDVKTGVTASCSISGSRYGIVNGVVATFAANVPPVEDEGLRGCPAFTQLAKMTETLTDASWLRPKTLLPILSGTIRGYNTFKCIEDTSAGTHVVPYQSTAFSGVSDNSVIGSSFIYKEAGRAIEIMMLAKTGAYISLCVISGGVVSSISSGTAVSVLSIGNGYYSVFVCKSCLSGATIPYIYERLHNGTTSTYTGDGVSGVLIGQPTYINFGVNGIPFIPPYVPNNTTSSVSVVSEASTSTTGTSFDLDLATLSRLKTGLRGPNAQGHIELEFESNVDSGWLASGITTNLNILSANNGVQNLLYLTKDSGEVLSFRINDGSAFTLTGVSGNVITVGQTFRISIDYGTYTDGTQKMRLTVNGVKSSVVAFSGSFGSQDLRFFFGNTIHVGWIKNIKLSPRPIW